MSKAILLSIKPKWVAKILNGEKTIEIRKTMPKCDLPITVYIYCTKVRNDGISYMGKGKVVAKFTLRKVEYIEATYDEYNYGEDDYATETLIPETLYDKSCVSREQMFNYLGLIGGYAYHIEDLVIFDKPRELSSFCKVGCIKKLENYIMTCPIQKLFQREMPEEVKQWVITKAPQSFCYVESEE